MLSAKILMWSANLKRKDPVAMEQPFGPLPLEEAIPEQGTKPRGPQGGILNNVH